MDTNRNISLSNRNIYKCEYTQVTIHRHIPLLSQLRGPRDDIPGTMNTSSAQILASCTILQYKEPGLEEMADCRAGAGSIEDEPGESYNGKK